MRWTRLAMATEEGPLARRVGGWHPGSEEGKKIDVLLDPPETRTALLAP